MKIEELIERMNYSYGDPKKEPPLVHSHKAVDKVDVRYLNFVSPRQKLGDQILRDMPADIRYSVHLAADGDPQGSEPLTEDKFKAHMHKLGKALADLPPIKHLELGLGASPRAVPSPLLAGAVRFMPEGLESLRIDNVNRYTDEPDAWNRIIGALKDAPVGSLKSLSLEMSGDEQAQKELFNMGTLAGVEHLSFTGFRAEEKRFVEKEPFVKLLIAARNEGAKAWPGLKTVGGLPLDKLGVPPVGAKPVTQLRGTEMVAGPDEALVPDLAAYIA